MSFAQLPPIEPGVSQDLAKWRAERYSDIRYKLDLTLEKMSPVLKGRVEVQVKLQKIDRVIPPVILDWRKLPGHESASTVKCVEINNQDCATDPKSGGFHFREENGHLIFNEGLADGYNYIKLEFTSPILNSGAAFRRYIGRPDGSEYIDSHFVASNASTAFPVFEQPDLKAIFKLDISCPKDWNVVSNSQRTNGYVENGENWVTGGGYTEYHQVFVETKPISVSDFAFAAGPGITTPQVPQRYAYMITGVVTDESGQPVVGIAVCAWDQSGRPINGRTPCTETKLAGRYELKFPGTPEKYSVWSSDQPGGLAFLIKRGKKRWQWQSDPATVAFGPTDGETRTVNLIVKRVLIQAE